MSTEMEGSSGSSKDEVPDLESTAAKESKPKNMSPGACKLRSWLNRTLRIEMTDGRVLIGVFLCTDRDTNVILGSCSEFLPADDDGANEEPRMLGLVMIPGRHIVSVHLDTSLVPETEDPSLPDVDHETDEVM